MKHNKRLTLVIDSKYSLITSKFLTDETSRDQIETII